MLKEYIDQLNDENNLALDKLEKQMNSLMGELSEASQWLEKLQTEKNVQTNIFSPRSISEENDVKINQASDKVKSIKHHIESVRDLIETHIRKKYEYEQLKLELSNYTENSDINSKTDSDAINLKQLLSELYRKTEVCLAFLNKDKNKCRNELNDMKRMLKKASSEIENEIEND